jgi:Fe2+ transport system protein FeoA
METKQEPLKALAAVKSGCKVRLVAIAGGCGLACRLAAMGMVPGTELQVIANGHPGPFIVRLRGTRLALGRGIAHKILVR